jgi:Gas vesicle synthesis protein GvpL/GvpF
MVSRWSNDRPREMTEPVLGCYAYGVVPAGEALALDGLSGVEPGSRVVLLTHRELGVVVSEVHLEEFGAEALKRNLEDLDWLERTARAHDAVLAHALSAEAVIPLRLCTIFDDEKRAREMLDSERGPLLDALARLRGRSEWNVKLLADPQAMEMQGREPTRGMAGGAGGGEPGSRGRAYFARKKQARAASDETRAAIEAAAKAIHSQLAERSAAAAVLPPQHPAVSGRAGRMVLNGAYLVDRARAREFAALADESAERYPGPGLAVECSGPWPPYHFVTTGRE